MPVITASVVYSRSFDEFVDAIRKAPPELEATLRRTAPQIARPMAEAVRRAQRASSERMVSSRLAPTTKATSLEGLPAVQTGGPPFTMGAEFGGQRRIARVRQPVYGKRPRSSYVKRTTMQFRPHVGRRGYEVWPTIRREQDKIVEGYSLAFDKAMKRVGLI